MLEYLVKVDQQKHRHSNRPWLRRNSKVRNSAQRTHLVHTPTSTTYASTPKAYSVRTPVLAPFTCSVVMKNIRMRKSNTGITNLGICLQMSLRTAPGFTEKAVALEPDAANLRRNSWSCVAARGTERRGETEVAAMRKIGPTDERPTTQRGHAESHFSFVADSLDLWRRIAQENLKIGLFALSFNPSKSWPHKKHVTHRRPSGPSTNRPSRTAPSPACCRRTCFPGVSGGRRRTTPNLYSPCGASQS